MDGDLRPLEIVGVVSDVRQTGLGDQPTPAIYTCFRQRPQGAWMWSAVMAGGAASPEVPPLAQAIARRLFPDSPARLRTMAGVLGESVAQRRLLLLLVALFGGVATLLSGAGVFGAVALAVAARRREVALRMALGADGGTVTRQALASGLRPVAFGLAGGLAIALAGSGLLRALLYGVAARHLPAYLGSVAAVAAVAALAAWIPARRAANVQPAAALRAE